MLTLLEAKKLVSGEYKREAVIEIFANESELVRNFPFIDIQGDSYSYNVEGVLPAVGFRGYNGTYTASAGVINPQTERLCIAGGYLDVDRMLIKTRGEGVRSTHEQMQIKALSLKITKTLINGDSLAAPAEFDGLRKRIVGPQLLTGTSSGTDGPLSLAKLDEAIDAVDQPNALIVSAGMKRRLSAAAAAGVGGNISYAIDQFGFRVSYYNDIPLYRADYDEVGARIIGFNEVGPSASSAINTSIYALRLDDGYVAGLQNGIMEVDDLGEISTSPVLRTRIDWLVGLAVMHPRSAARIWGITDAAITV